MLGKLFLLFIIYSFIGWIVEIVYNCFIHKKFVNRGFLIGPYCPIYGFGAILVTIFLTQFRDNFIVAFVMSVFLFSILEYSTSYLMEKIFKARWWDYSDYKFNINGRICLETMIPFGLLGCFVIYVTDPLLKSLLLLMNPLIIDLVSFTLFVIFIIDLFVSLKIINSFKKTAVIFLKRDNTEEITKKVKAILLNKSVWTKRLMQAFPKVKAVIGNINIDFIKTKLELKKTKEKLKETQKELHITEKKLEKTKEKLKK